MRAKMDDDDATDRDRATGRAKRRQRARDAVDDEDEAAMREAFLDGAELFALGTAVAVTAVELEAAKEVGVMVEVEVMAAATAAAVEDNT